MKKLLVFSISTNVVLVWVIVMLWNLHTETLKSIEVTWDSPKGLFPRKFNEEEKNRIDELLPAIEAFISKHRPLDETEKVESIYDPFYINDVEILPEQTTIQISFFRDLENESYELSWERSLPLYKGEGGRLVEVISDDFMPRRFTFNSQGKLIEPK